jgi:hypothetical protein
MKGMQMKPGIYPDAVDPSKVGSYPALVKSGGGFFYDEILEYRVWCHPEQGAPPQYGDGDDYFYSFPSYDEAMAFHDKTKGSEMPLVLVRQRECVDEPEPGKYEHVKEERRTEWQCEWLRDGPRKPGDIEDLLKKSK